VCFFVAHAAAGALRTRHSLRPIISRGQEFRHYPGGSRRGNAESHSSLVMPRFMRGIQYAVTSRKDAAVPGILDRPVEPGDDVRVSCLKNESVPPLNTESVAWAKALCAVPTTHRQFHPEWWARLRSSSYGGQVALPTLRRAFRDQYSGKPVGNPPRSDGGLSG
jgi:hypothetical protein